MWRRRAVALVFYLVGVGRLGVDLTTTYAGILFHLRTTSPARRLKPVKARVPVHAHGGRWNGSRLCGAWNSSAYWNFTPGDMPSGWAPWYSGFWRAHAPERCHYLNIPVSATSLFFCCRRSVSLSWWAAFGLRDGTAVRFFHSFSRSLSRCH